MDADQRRAQHYNQLRRQYYDLIAYGNAHPHERQQNLHQLRQLVLLEGIPPETEEEIANRHAGNNTCGLRGLVWKILLNVKNIDPEKYIAFVKARPPDAAYQQIRKDAPRTFMNNKDFAKSVSQEKLIRCLSAFSRYCSDTPGKVKNINFIQGMNTLCGPFLFCMPEIDAFYAFSTFIVDNFYMYVQKNVDGARAGEKLLARVLSHVDPELYKYLQAHSFYPELLHHTVLSLGTSTPPLEEALQLWDFYFAFGVHMNIVCVAAHLLLVRDSLLAHPSPASKLRSLPPLHAQSIVALAVQLVRQLPNDLYDMLALHPIQSIQIP